MRKISAKEVKSLTEVVGQRLFVIPISKSNDVDIVTGERIVFVQVNGQPHYIPCGRPTPIPYNAFCVLRDVGIMQDYMSYEEGGSLEAKLERVE